MSTTSAIRIVRQSPLFILERLMSDVVAAFLQEGVCARDSGRQESFSPDLPWVFLRIEGGSEVGVALHDAKFVHKSRIARLSQAIVNLGAVSVPVTVIPGFSKGSPGTQNRFELIAVDSGRPTGGWLTVASPHAEVLTQPSDSGVSESVVQRVLRRSLPVTLEVVAATLPLCNSASPAPAYQIQSCWLRRDGLYIARGRMIMAHSGNFVVVVEETMNQPMCSGDVAGEIAQTAGPAEMEVTIALGAITISVDDLLALRPGTEIQVDCKTGSNILIQLNNATWASAHLQAIDALTGAASIKIVEIFPLDRKLLGKKCDVVNEGIASPLPEARV